MRLNSAEGLDVYKKSYQLAMTVFEVSKRFPAEEKFVLTSQIRRLRHVERLTNSALGSYRFRVVDYRVVFDLYAEEIVILRVGHRREIHRSQ